ncbi:hypothetical protein CYQ88_11275 [Hydrogenovibrio sp. SC-1]|nr:hypothetical protein CYQ88_11275 [Hydrogenovibrio sp. SC-1]
MLLQLLQCLDTPKLRELSVIPWASPVLSFGDLSSSRVATLGLNPSNREFVDASGHELMGSERRFHTLNSLGIKKWSEATGEDLDQIISSCYGYFGGNSYDSWFRALEKLFIEANVSYYGMFSDACHLDLVPFATETKWGELSLQQRSRLLEMSGDILGWLLRDSGIEVLVLNGKSVIENLQAITGTSFKREIVSDWVLPRRSSKGVTGYSYKGKISQVSGVKLGREILVLGYNHNLQSSFGVTNEVKTSIQGWISQNTREAFC